MSHTDLRYLPIHFTLCVGILSHLLLFICLIKDPLKCFRNSAAYLITNLALSDFIACTAGLMRFTFSGSEYVIVLYISEKALLVSMLSIFSIAIDRYMLTVHPLKHRVFLNGRRIVIWIVLIWLLCFSLLVKELILGSYQTTYLIYNILFVIMALVTFSIYILIYFFLRKREREFSQNQSQSQNRVLQGRFLKTIMIVAFVQMLTLVPAGINALVHGPNGSIRTGLSVVSFILLGLYCLNFSMNPFLYVWRLRNYRQTFRLVFCRGHQRL